MEILIDHYNGLSNNIKWKTAHLRVFLWLAKWHVFSCVKAGWCPDFLKVAKTTHPVFKKAIKPSSFRNSALFLLSQIFSKIFENFNVYTVEHDDLLNPLFVVWISISIFMFRKCRRWTVDAVVENDWMLLQIKTK